MQNQKNLLLLPTSRFSQKISDGSGAFWKYQLEDTEKKAENIVLKILTKIFDWPAINLETWDCFLKDTKIYPVNSLETSVSWFLFSKRIEISPIFSVNSSIYSCKSSGHTNVVKQH